MLPSEIITNYTSSIFINKKITPRAVVGATCILSMIGSALIIVTFFAFKKLRNQTRHILLHLSLMDFGVALANFIGVVVYFDKYYNEHYDPHYKRYNGLPDVVQYSCEIQAAIAITCNNSSVLWTIAVAVYLHFRIVTYSGEDQKRFFRMLVLIMLVICYGLPITLTIWLALTHRVGFAPYDSTGWCTLIVLNRDKTKDDIYADILGNDLWVLIAFIVIPLLYLSIRIHTKRQYATMKVDGATKAKFQKIVDYKFTVIPLFFILIRAGSVLVSVLFEYIKIDPDDENIRWLSLIILYASGIGDSAQGAVNGVLFVLMTKTARDMICRAFCCGRRKNSSDSQSINTSTMDDDETSPLVSDKHESSTSRTLVIIQDT